jgi:ABC-type branched-subunit amino acid transport system substrate-binding protein
VRKHTLVTLALAALLALIVAAVTTTSRAQDTERTVSLSPGCNMTTLTFGDGTDAATLTTAVSPSTALQTVWRLDNATGTWQAFMPQAPQASDLTSLNLLDAAFICVNDMASISMPPVSLDPAGTIFSTALAASCNAIGLSFPDGTSPSQVASAVTPPAALESIWRYEASQGSFQAYMAAAPQASDLTSLHFLDAVYLCTAAPGSVATPSLEGMPPRPKLPPAPQALRLGVLVDYTGDLSDFGPAQENAARLAAKEINAAGGVLGQPIEIVTGDSGTDPSVGVAEANRLVRVEGVHAILGSLASGVTLPIAESVTGPNRVLQISPASVSPALTGAHDSDFLFRTTISDAAQGIVLARLARDMGLGSVCTMYINNAYGQGISQTFTENFEAAGGTVTAQVPHESGQTTYASELDKCTSGNPEALAALAYPQSGRVFLREAVEAEKVKTFLFCDGTKSESMFDAIGWEPFNGMRGTAPTSLTLEAGTAFEAAYEAEYGETPPLPFMREMYDAVYLVALAAEMAGSVDPTAIRNALRTIANAPGETVNPGSAHFQSARALIAAGTDINYEGASGPVDFDLNGDVMVGAIETWRVDALNQHLVTDQVFRVNAATREVLPIPLP